MKLQKHAITKSLLAMLLCVAMLIGSTFAWFTDQVTTVSNVIQSGKLDIEMYWTDDLDTNVWYNVEDGEHSTVFSYDNWEPGYTDVKYIKLVNKGNLALNYQLTLTPESGIGKLAEVINVYYSQDGVEVETREDLQELGAVGLLDSVLNGGATVDGTLLAQDQQSPFHPTGEVVITLAMSMLTSAGNEYQNEDAGTFTITALATQAPFESDSFGSDYDANAEYPTILTAGSATASVTPVDGKVPAGGVTLVGEGISAYVPEGVVLEEGTDKLTLTITPLEKTSSDITVVNGEILIPVDVHIEGVAEDNTVPIIIELGEVLPKYLNMGNYHLYHVENGANSVMTLVADASELTAHNTFTYDPLTGEISVAMATFSEVALVAEPAAWEGKVDYSWYTEDAKKAKSFTIANADQLNALAKIVGGMDGQSRYNFEGDTVVLVSDINLDDAEATPSQKIFYPIGYWYNGYGEEGNTESAPSSTLYSFNGTFDGQGHTVYNFYQNTWEVKGDYDGNYYRDGFGLFGKIYGGTVKNLSVSNFTSDGEHTTTGVIASYAEGATFENIAITNCNPRVYNIGNGGIVGCVGWYAREEGLKTTFKNITVDNTNKISALWGSYDVACGGIVGQYYPTSGQSSANYPVNAGIHFENCHVSAVMDVYNDVCANYQYYAYRYAGMIIGSIRENETINGHVYPDMTGITASGCTVHYDTWNDYYYCELVANSLASYTHDHQFSRLTEVTSVNNTTNPYTYTDLSGQVHEVGEGTYNFVVRLDGEYSTENAECYHFVDGKVHNHKDYNGDGVEDFETINGETIYVEDHYHIYLPFAQLFTGYGWGVTSMGIEDYDGIETMDITHSDQLNSVPKFEVTDNVLDTYTTGKTITIGDLFKEVDPKPEVEIKKENVQVFVSPADENSTAGAEYKANTTDWTKGTLTFSGTGVATITITDYYFCTPTTITVNIIDRQAEEKFQVVMNNGDFLHRVGNVGDVPLNKLFAAKDGASIGNVSVTVEAVDGTVASGTYTANTSEWARGTIKFSNTGVVKVTITDNDYCIPTVLYLEVVDAVNATSATSATANNVVLLNDCGFSSLEVKNGYSLYGNGFTMTCGSDSAALDMGYSFVTLDNGTLDNVQIVTPNFDHAVLYKSNMASGNRSEKDGDKTRYFNVKSGVMVSGNSQILNSRISGARAAVNVTGGNVLIDNSRIELGAVASLLIGAANEVTLRNVTLVQKPTASTYDSSKVLMGFSVLSMCDTNGNSAPINLEGTLIQNAWVNEEYKKYVPSDGQNIVKTVLKEEDYLHDIDGDGTNESLNLGIAYMPESATSQVKALNISDNRSNINEVPYGAISVLDAAYVYSYKNANGTDDAIKYESVYVPNKYGDIITVNYADTADGLTTGKSFSSNGWVYELNVDLDKLSGYKLDFSKLTISINGVSVTDYKVNGSTKPSTVDVTAGGTTYTLTATVDGKEYTAYYKVTGTETSKESPTLVSSNWGTGICVASKKGGTWHGAAPALEGIQIKYWSVAEKQYKTINLADYTPTTKGKQNGTNTTWTYSPDNGDFTLTLTGGQVHSSNKVYAMPVVVQNNGKNVLYFVAASSNGLVNTGNSARTIPVTYTFKDNNNGDTLTFSHTWSVSEDQENEYGYDDFCNGTMTKLESSSSGGCVTPDTLITLADGSQVRVDSLTGDEMLLVWNMETGKLDSAPIMFIDSEEEAEYEVIKLYFSDNTEVKVIYEHGFWDYDLNRYVYLDRNAADYIGHTFAKQDGDSLVRVTLVDVQIETQKTTAWSPVTAGHLCYFVNGMLSMPGGVGGLFNIFEVDPETMTYDLEAMQRDIEKHGLFTYEEVNAITPLSEDMFYAAGGQYLKISIGKGNMTVEELEAMIQRYSKFI